MAKAVLPASTLCKAAHYTLTLLRKPTHFLEYPQLELSNNLAENSMPPGRPRAKIWIHARSPQAGPKVATVPSVAEGCRGRKDPAVEYLAEVPSGFGDIRVQRLPELTPAAWAAANR